MPEPLTKEEIKQLNVARVRDALFDGVYALWQQRKREGLTQSTLAAELGRDRAWVSRTLRGPANWTVRSVAELLAALDGKLEVAVIPRERPAADNYDHYSAVFDATKLTAVGAVGLQPLPLAHTGEPLARHALSSTSYGKVLATGGNDAGRI